MQRIKAKKLFTVIMGSGALFFLTQSALALDSGSNIKRIKVKLNEVGNIEADKTFIEYNAEVINDNFSAEAKDVAPQAAKIKQQVNAVFKSLGGTEKPGLTKGIGVDSTVWQVPLVQAEEKMHEALKNLNYWQSYLRLAASYKGYYERQMALPMSERETFEKRKSGMMPKEFVRFDGDLAESDFNYLLNCVVLNGKFLNNHLAQLGLKKIPDFLMQGEADFLCDHGGSFKPEPFVTEDNKLSDQDNQRFLALLQGDIASEIYPSPYWQMMLETAFVKGIPDDAKSKMAKAMLLNGKEDDFDENLFLKTDGHNNKYAYKFFMDFSAGACRTAEKRINDLQDAGWIDMNKVDTISSTSNPPGTMSPREQCHQFVSTKILLRMDEILGWYAKDIDSFDGGGTWPRGLTADLLQKRQNSGSIMTPDELRSLVAGLVKQLFTVEQGFSEKLLKSEMLNTDLLKQLATTFPVGELFIETEILALFVDKVGQSEWAKEIMAQKIDVISSLRLLIKTLLRDCNEEFAAGIHSCLQTGIAKLGSRTAAVSVKIENESLPIKYRFMDE